MIFEKTIDYRVLIKANNEKNHLACYTDSHFSYGRVILFHNNNPISWKAVKQNEIGLSSTEAVYLAFSEAIKEVVISFPNGKSSHIVFVEFFLFSLCTNT